MFWLRGDGEGDGGVDEVEGAALVGGGVGVIIIICSFSNPVSRRDLLTCDDGSCLMRCHRAFVSNSCHFFRSPLSLPWRHIQSLRDADQPVRKVPSRDGYPRRSARIVQRSVGDERPSSTAHLASPSMDSLYYPSSSQFQERCAPLLRPIARPLDPQEVAVARSRSSREQTAVFQRGQTFADEQVVHRRA